MGQIDPQHNTRARKIPASKALALQYPHAWHRTAGDWPWGALEAPDPKCDGCKRNRLTGARCSGSQSNRGRTGSTRGRVCTSESFFWTGSRLSHASSLASWGHGHQRTRRCWRWRISLIKDSINILQLSGKGLVARWPAIWWASTPGFVLFSEKAGA